MCAIGLDRMLGAVRFGEDLQMSLTQDLAFTVNLGQTARDGTVNDRAGRVIALTGIWDRAYGSGLSHAGAARVAKAW